MSIATVVTRGYGTWGSLNKLPTWGYDVLAAPVYTRIGTLYGASKQVGTLHGATKERGVLSGASKEIGTLTGAN